MANERTQARSTANQTLSKVKKDEEQHPVQPKISNGEAVSLLLYVGLCDGIGIGLATVGLDDFGVLDMLTFPVTRIYFYMKGIKGTFDLVTSGLEAIPYVSALPLKTLGVAAVIYQDRKEANAKVAEINKSKLIQARQMARSSTAAPQPTRTPARSGTTAPALSLVKSEGRIPKRLAA